AVFDMRRDAGEKVHLRGKQVDVQDALQALTDIFEIIGQQDPQAEPSQRADNPDTGAAQHEDAQDHRPRGAHRPPYRDVAALILQHHDHARDDIEGGDQDDQRQDQEHHVPLDLDRVDDAGIGALPVENARLAAERGRDQPGFGRGAVGVGYKDFEV